MLKIYLIRWNHPASYRGIPTELEDIRLLLDQRSEAEVSIIANRYFHTFASGLIFSIYYLVLCI